MMTQRGTRLEVDGKFFRRGGERLFVNAVTYGPFPDPQPDHFAELRRVADAGFNTIRLYEAPNRQLLDAAQENGLMVMAGVSWEWYRLFLGGPNRTWLEEGRLNIRMALQEWGEHEAVVAFFVANEVPSDLARWMGPAQVKTALEDLIEEARRIAPWLLVGYANYPSSEYLEPGNADFTAFNIYLEERDKLAGYLPRLHHLAGDRPVLLTEFGLDTRRNAEEKQREALKWFYLEAVDAGMAGCTVFAWSDRWRIGEREEREWDFGLVRRDGSEKPALEVAGKPEGTDFEKPRISVIICVYNGEERIGAALESLRQVDYPDYEVIVVDDGSTDGTLEVVRSFDFVKLVQANHGGLSVARNAGAAAATGEILAYTDDDCEVDRGWLHWLARGYAEHGWDALGGPNIPPEPAFEDEAVVASAPGAPSHVMLSDELAEHIPGCNLTVRKAVFEALGGFRAAYLVAGDDVDFCWRLEEGGYKIGFEGAAFVWHRRRTTFYRYLKQQWGYGKAEAILKRDHPERFRGGVSAHWRGRVYTGEPMGVSDGSVIYFGAAGLSGYQQVEVGMMPRRALYTKFKSPRAELKLRVAEWLQPRLRHWARCFYTRSYGRLLKSLVPSIRLSSLISENGERIRELFYHALKQDDRVELLLRFQEAGWQHAEDTSPWDLKKGDVHLLFAMLKVGPDKWKLGVRICAPALEINYAQAEVEEILGPEVRTLE
ncbi:Glycosyltransferase, GT2 family [Rubritalea squalenifaciens DSM 18772]|uniref:Glycosyltransferase, GT2 family n=1 Tax=Rubritalea squalenifaciens DSM 18772 TaxID=1123071 RepID=A0A1M6KRG6_9BACT|nr:glycosyltransferase [Rubritalea squalenifaciens]SHJ61539.1 Glycosyltransferase, GT2 family [Rubritalea squalenifaciens DSM 18772]